MSQLTAHRRVFVALAACLALTFLALPAHGSQACDVSTAMVASPDAAEGLFAPEPVEKVTAPKYGPCTMSFRCSTACGGQFITCSGQDYCQMNYGPSNPWCYQNIYVQCDDQEPVYCIGSLELE